MNNIMDTLGYGGIVAIIGMLIVFAGLIILIAFVWGAGKIFQSIDKRKAAKAVQSAPAPVAAPAPAPVAAEETAPVQESAEVNDAALIAVIAAAIAAYDNGSKNLVIRKVRRVSGWKDAARSEQVYHF